VSRETDIEGARVQSHFLKIKAEERYQRRLDGLPSTQASSIVASRSGHTRNPLNNHIEGLG
jgi:glucose-6-phosphate isomerase